MELDHCGDICGASILWVSYFLSITHQIAMHISKFTQLFSNFDLQANISPNPTKDQLVNAIQQHFSSQVYFLALALIPPLPNTHMHTHILRHYTSTITCTKLRFQREWTVMPHPFLYNSMWTRYKWLWNSSVRPRDYNQLAQIEICDWLQKVGFPHYL